MFPLYVVVLYSLFVWRFVYPLKWPRRWKFALAALVLPLSQVHLLYRLTWGTMFSPELPRGLILTLMWLFSSFIVVCLLTLVRDLAWTVLSVFSRRLALPLREKGRYSIALLALLLAGTGVWQGVRSPDVQRMEVALPHLPKALDGLQVVQLTDLHISRLYPAQWVQGVVERTNRLNPDLILISGDLIDGWPQNRTHDVAPLAGLKARHGVIAIPGNHEYYFGFQEWKSVFEGLGMTMLENSHVRVGQGSDSLVVAGVADPVASRFGQQPPDLKRALNGVTRDQALILLDHRPNNAPQAAAAGVGLQLSGHTHGGMMPGLDAVVAWVNKGFVSGLYQVGGLQLYVSNGTGMWNGFPIRLGPASEITLFTLRSTEAG